MKKINIAELLKDCPSGMELYCVLYDNLYFDSVNADYYGTINCYTLIDGIKTSINFTKYGTFNNHTGSKCVIFPKGKTTWEGFVPPCKFKDGDVIYAKSKSILNTELVGIYKKEDNERIYDYCSVSLNSKSFYHHNVYGLIHKSIIDISRIATEEEKQKLFDAIKKNGYKWNEETKTLENLIESKEDTDDKIVMSGIYFDSENYADEVELHLGNYEIEIRDGKTYAVFKNQKTNTFEKFPKFKDGDILFVKSAYDWIIIYKESENDEDLYKYAAIPDRQYRPYRTYMIYDNNPLCYKGDISKIRLATEEEKKRLFQAIKDKGYHWNSETKILEKLVEPRFKVGDKIRHKTNNKDDIYEISKVYDDSYGLVDVTWMLDMKYQDNWELVIEPKFKVGDEIVKRNSISNSWIVSSVSSEYYGLKLPNGIDGIGVLPVSEQDDWELILNIKPKFKVGDRIKYIYFDRKVAKVVKIHDKRYELDNGKFIEFQDENAYEIYYDKFDITTLKPFDKVLMRSSNAREWTATFYSHYSNDYFFGCGMVCQQCIPYKGNEWLLGKTDDCDEYYKTW